jgi:flagellar L-ring protein FlgH
MKRMRLLFVFSGVTLLGANELWAQNSRLFDRSVPVNVRSAGGPTVDNASWITVPVPPPKEIRVHDIVTIRVDLTARTTQEGEMQRRKTSNYNALLSSWVLLEGLTQIKPAPQTNGDQNIAGQLNNQYRATGEYETSESLKFEIAANVAAILPNGNLVLEAHRKVKNNDELWLHSLSGVCHKDAVGPGNVILSKDIASLEVTKEEMGHIRDSYERGWLQKWWDRMKAF